jgi:hypothetical protein
MNTFFRRLANGFRNETDAYIFDKEVYESIGDFVHGDSLTIKTIYIPDYDLYVHYYESMGRFIVSKDKVKFDESNKEYKNIKKIKISTSFIGAMLDIYETDQDTKKLSEQNKYYYDSL